MNNHRAAARYLSVLFSATVHAYSRDLLVPSNFTTELLPQISPRVIGEWVGSRVVSEGLWFKGVKVSGHRDLLVVVEIPYLARSNSSMHSNTY